MKRFLTIAALVAVILTSYSQSLGYNDLGILFGQDNTNGTSRFNAMSGAFGALGSDISSVGINPAGAAVATNSTFSVTLGNRETNINATYYNNTTNNTNDSFNVSQAGGILMFDASRLNEWNRFAMSFNYRVKNDFNSNFTASGNSGLALFNEHPNDTSDPINQYNNGQEQSFSNSTSGESSVFSLGFSAAHKNKLYVGASINLHDVQFQQRTQLTEINEDNNGNTLNAFNEQNIYFEANGFSLGLGFIYKLHQNFRIGLAYESPTWYPEVFEENDLREFDPSNSVYDDWVGYTEISATNIPQPINTFDNQEPDFNPNTDFYLGFIPYRLRTPSKLTASGAIIFDKQGLLSIDYSYKDYSNTTYSNLSFANELNQIYNQEFRATHAVNIGTEWRFDRLSLRGGYHFEQSPIINALDKDNLKGYSAGFGYNFGNYKFDLAYRKSETNSPYPIYNSPNVTVNSAELNTNTSRITGTLTFNL